MKIAVIGGGNMGRAIAFGMINGGVVVSKDVRISDPAQEVHEIVREFSPKINLFTSSVEAIKGVDIVIVAVKPWLLEEVLRDISSVLDRDYQSLVSIVAGVDFEQIKSYIDGDIRRLALYRVIPNTAVALGKGTSFISSYNSSESRDKLMFSLFDALGKVFMVDEKEMWAVTALSSCGIAYAYKYMDAAIAGGVEMGIEETKAREIVMQTIKGALSMLETNGTMPQMEIDKVTTPGGITLKGLAEMEKQGFSNAVKKGLFVSK